jgi:hypothetical protein
MDGDSSDFGTRSHFRVGAMKEVEAPADPLDANAGSCRRKSASSQARLTSSQLNHPANFEGDASLAQDSEGQIL